MLTAISPYKGKLIMQFQHQNNAQKGEFFLNDAAGQRIAEISYVWRDATTIVADHTWVDDSLRGQGMARQLLDVLVEYAREQQLKIVPVCSYVDVMFKRDQSLLDVAA
jgi:predicted GNAT family acetyltransferase